MVRSQRENAKALEGVKDFLQFEIEDVDVNGRTQIVVPGAAAHCCGGDTVAAVFSGSSIEFQYFDVERPMGAGQPVYHT